MVGPLPSLQQLDDEDRIPPHALLPEDEADEHPVSNANEG